MGLRRIDTLSKRIDISLETIAPDNGNFRKIDSCLKRRERAPRWNIIPANTDFNIIDTHANDEIFHTPRHWENEVLTKWKYMTYVLLSGILYRIIRSY